MNKKLRSFDVIIIGGGHAGIESAYASAKLGCKTALITLDKNKIALAPCNPSIGGIGKGHIVFEVSALGGLMPKLCSKACLQAHMLNTKKGTAVQGLRLQIDKYAYSKYATKELEKVDNLTIIEALAEEIFTENSAITGIKIESGETIKTRQLILTTGTFLNGLIHIGDNRVQAGRRNERAAIKLSSSMKKIGLELGRLKTGTPPRLLTKSINFSKLEKQEVAPLEYLFEFNPIKVKNKVNCYIAQTNEKTHRIILDNIKESALYSGNIKGTGPRYCPSIEDKLVRFADKPAHHIFVEPESEDHVETYPSGISTSLPKWVQDQYIASIKGFEKAKITQYGYAIEYDFIQPNQLKHSLETKKVSGLFCAGQINGTTGYEEAAGQGIIAGINAALKIQKKDPFILEREESYIGVMIDDLITLGVDEPYRMFTSRAERRLMLRQDNAFLRIMPKAYKLGLIPEKDYQEFLSEKKQLNDAIQDIENRFSSLKLVRHLEAESNPKKLVENLGLKVSGRNALTILSHIKYKEYIRREQSEIDKFNKFKNLEIPSKTIIATAQGISTELKQKISHYNPKTIAQAKLIPGMTPAATSMLILLSRKEEQGEK